MSHLIFPTPEHPYEGEIPYAHSGDLIHALLAFDSEDLDLKRGQQAPELFLLQKACELNKWTLKGDYPRFYLERQLEITLTARNQAFCRILNARSHEVISPLTLDDLQGTIQKQLALSQARPSDIPAFLERLFRVYAQLEPDTPEGLTLATVFQVFTRLYPGYRREFFGQDLNRCLNSGRRQVQGHLLSVLPAHGPQGFYVFDTTGTGQWIDRITFTS